MTVWRLMVHHLDEHIQQSLRWSERTGTLAIGWGQTGDLRDQPFHDERALSQIVAACHDGISSSSAAHGGRSLWRFYKEVAIGDLVILSTGSSRPAVFQVTGDYFYVGDEYPPYYEHRRKADLTHLNGDLLWKLSGGAAPGDSVRWTFARCRNRLTEEQVKAISR